MSKTKQERINDLARSLKEMHLASSVEEAMQRAKEIIESEDGDDKPIGELMAAQEQEKAHAKYVEETENKQNTELRQEVTEETGEESSLQEKGETLLDPLGNVNADLFADVHEHELEKAELEETTEKVEDIKCAADDVEFVTDTAQKVQDKEKEKKESSEEE